MKNCTRYLLRERELARWYYHRHILHTSRKHFPRGISVCVCVCWISGGGAGVKLCVCVCVVTTARNSNKQTVIWTQMVECCSIWQLEQTVIFRVAALSSRAAHFAMLPHRPKPPAIPYRPLFGVAAMPICLTAFRLAWSLWSETTKFSTHGWTSYIVIRTWSWCDVLM